MKSNGVEIRSNGCEVRRSTHWLSNGCYYNMYHAKIKHPSGATVDSKNGPWDYLANARNDADKGATGVNAA